MRIEQLELKLNSLGRIDTFQRSRSSKNQSGLVIDDFHLAVSQNFETEEDDLLISEEPFLTDETPSRNQTPIKRDNSPIKLITKER